MAVQICPYHDRIQKELNGIVEVVTELREWRAAEEVRQEGLEEKLKILDEKLQTAVSWIKWSVGVSVAAIASLLAAVLALLGGKSP